MNKRFINSLLPALGAVLIPQLLFFWIAPEERCRFAVYPFATVLTIGNAALCLWSLNRFGLRRSAGLVVLGHALTFATLVASALLLTFDATLRTTGFVLAISAVLYLVCMIPMTIAAESDNVVSDPPPQGSEPEAELDLPEHVIEMRDNFVAQAARQTREAAPPIPKRKTPPPLPRN